MVLPINILRDKRVSFEINECNVINLEKPLCALALTELKCDASSSICIAVSLINYSGN